MLLQMAVVAVYGDEELRAEQVNHQALLFLAGMTADVDETGGAIVVDNVGVAAAEMVDDAEDAFLVAGNNGVAGGDARVFVIVDGGPAERAHRLPLRAADEDHDLFGGIVVDLAGVDDKRGGQIEIAEVLGNLRGFEH